MIIHIHRIQKETRFSIISLNKIFDRQRWITVDNIYAVWTLKTLLKLCLYGHFESYAKKNLMKNTVRIAMKKHIIYTSYGAFLVAQW